MNYYIYYYFYSKKFLFLLFILNILKFKNNTSRVHTNVESDDQLL